MTRLFSWLIAGALAMSLVAATAQAGNTLVHIAQGQVSGITDHGARAWLGLPFATSPVGDLRWKPPQPAASWTGVHRADHFAASCQQGISPQGFGPWTHEYVTHGAVSEDCLYLNIWAPAKTVKKRPVLVWIYGGGFNSGSGAVPIYNGATLAAKGIIVVNMNYRVGLYGFLSHPGLDKENPQGASGNYGLMDQINALQWVRTNIAAFGGDPDNVTIAGQSAGSASVHALIDSAMAKGLFVRAIAESGSGMGMTISDHTVANANGVKFAQAAGATDIAQLRALTPAQLDTAAKGLSFGLSIDGAVFPDAATADHGNHNDVPVLTGMTANEGSAFASQSPATADDLGRVINRDFGADAPAIAALYPAGDHPGLAKETVARDRGLASMYLWAANRKSHAPVYAYLWTHVEPGPDAARYKAFHSSELPYVFGTLDTSDRPFTAADRALSQTAQAYWLNFIRRGNPNGPGLPHWPALKTSDRLILNIGDNIRTQTVLAPAELDAFAHHVKDGGTLGLFSAD